MYENITYIAAVVLIPLVPAFVLYRFLPQGRTNVKGPFRGLDIKLSGAFAGYFLVVLMVAGFVVFLIKRKPESPPPPSYNYEVYTVTGKIDLQPGEQSAPKFDPDEIILSLRPKEYSVGPNGAFNFDIPVKLDQAGQRTFPDLILYHPGYEQGTVPLDVNSPFQRYNLNCNKDTKKIEITSSISLKPSSTKPYQANTQAQPEP